MDRRKFVLSVGALAGGGSLALGTGAFSSVEAERDVGVTVADDASAYLGIQPGTGLTVTTSTRRTTTRSRSTSLGATTTSSVRESTRTR